MSPQAAEAGARELFLTRKVTRHGPLAQWRFRPEQQADKKTKLTIQYRENKFIFQQQSLRKLPDLKGNYFEKNWPDFLCGEIYRKQ